ncbi:MAG: hypothetical protein C0404_02840 [Verrucomicrobia bacterium]|nr:hypothetical protein [Verrucomicrobiota bacterium]
MKIEDIKRIVRKKTGESLLWWEGDYLDFHARRYADTLSLLGEGRNRRMLDIGSYPGHLAFLAQELGYEVFALTGLNEHSNSLKIVTDRFKALSIPVMFADIEKDQFMFPEGFFDVVLAAEVIEHMAFNPFRLLKESFRVLKPGGRIIISTPNIARLENALKLFAGRSFHPDLHGNFHELFSSILSHRHTREYTAGDLKVMLEEQHMEMYRFTGTRTHYSACFDPAWSLAAAPLLAAKKIWPRFKSNLLVEATKPANVTLIQPREVEPAEGFYPVEDFPADVRGRARAFAAPCRWSAGASRLMLPLGHANYQVFSFHVAHFAPPGVAPLTLTFRSGNVLLDRIRCFQADKFSLVSIVVPRRLSPEKQLALSIDSSVWSPAESRVPDNPDIDTSDQRRLGALFGWDGFLREDFDTIHGLRTALTGRDMNPEVLMGDAAIEESPMIERFYRNTEDGASRIVMGSGRDDSAQLLPRWCHVERWEGDVRIRWSTESSSVLLRRKVRAGTVRVRLFTGILELGPKVTGEVELEWSDDTINFKHGGLEKFDLPSANWVTLSVRLSPEATPDCVVKVTIRVNPTRVPALIDSKFTDLRALGVAVASIEIR